MSSHGEKIGSALAKAFKGTAAAMKEREAPPVMYVTNLADVPKAEGLAREDGWVDTQVQFLIDRASAGAGHVVGRTVLAPGARHETHRHRDCDAFVIVLEGHGHIYTDRGDKPSKQGDVVYCPRGCWHGFTNTSGEEVVLLWGLLGAGSLADSGYEVWPEGHKD